jgi:hypothetical protein
MLPPDFTAELAYVLLTDAELDGQLGRITRAMTTAKTLARHPSTTDLGNLLGGEARMTGSDALCLSSATFGVHVVDVVLRSAEEQVSHVATRRVVAAMEHPKAIRHGPAGHDPSGNVRADQAASLARADLPVTPRVAIAGPLKTARLNRYQASVQSLP